MKFDVIDQVGGKLLHTVEMEPQLDGTYLAKLHGKTARVTPSRLVKGVTRFELWALTTQLRKQNLLSAEGAVIALSNHEIVSTSLGEQVSEEQLRRLMGREIANDTSDLIGYVD